MPNFSIISNFLVLEDEYDDLKIVVWKRFIHSKWITIYEWRLSCKKCRRREEDSDRNVKAIIYIQMSNRIN